MNLRDLFTSQVVGTRKLMLINYEEFEKVFTNTNLYMYPYTNGFLNYACTRINTLDQ